MSIENDNDTDPCGIPEFNKLMKKCILGSEHTVSDQLSNYESTSPQFHSLMLFLADNLMVD